MHTTTAVAGNYEKIQRAGRGCGKVIGRRDEGKGPGRAEMELRVGARGVVHEDGFEV